MTLHPVVATHSTSTLINLKQLCSTMSNAPVILLFSANGLSSLLPE